MTTSTLVDIDLAGPCEHPTAWAFDEKNETFLIAVGSKEETVLSLSKNPKSDGERYSILVQPDSKSICNVIAHMADKPWVDNAALLEAMLPAIRAVLKRIPYANTPVRVVLTKTRTPSPDSFYIGGQRLGAS
jgi:hypothetical protein